MNTWTVDGIEVPKFSNYSYEIWKFRITLYMKAMDRSSLKILESGPFVPRNDELVPKGEIEYTERDKELISLDADLQSLIVESMDSDMRHRIKDCVSAKHMWETIAATVEGTKEKMRLNFLISEYKDFKSLPGESVRQLFGRYTQLLDEMSTLGKNYSQKQINRKIILTLPNKLKNKVSSNRNGLDFNTMSLDELYTHLRTYDVEIEQTNVKHKSKTVDNKNKTIQ